MAITFEIIENNKDKILDELGVAIPRALEAAGLLIEGYAKAKCPVDTGLLRNSITHALGGQEAAIKVYHADSAKGAVVKGGKKLKTYKTGAATSMGWYEGTAPPEENTVFIGTNVEYAPYVEYGHMLPGSTGKSGSIKSGAHFLQSAMTGHPKKVEQIIEQALKGF